MLTSSWTRCQFLEAMMVRRTRTVTSLATAEKVSIESIEYIPLPLIVPCNAQWTHQHNVLLCRTIYSQCYAYYLVMVTSPIIFLDGSLLFVLNFHVASFSSCCFLKYQLPCSFVSFVELPFLVALYQIALFDFFVALKGEILLMALTLLLRPNNFCLVPCYVTPSNNSFHLTLFSFDLRVRAFSTFF